MGNRAVIALNDYSPEQLGIYVHWNGGKDSIDGFLHAAKQISGGDKQYGSTRLVQVITTFFAETSTSVGIDLQKNLDCDNYDNGVYVVDTSTFEITNRHFKRHSEQLVHNSEELGDEIIKAINAGIEATKDEE